MSESLRDTIEPKSDQLNADDLIAGPITVRIEGVKRSASPDQPIDVMISGHRPFRPCKSMRRVMISIWGDHGTAWVGQSMTLYRDPDVKFGGVAVGGIRISHVTGITEPRTLMLTTTRAKRANYVVKPLAVANVEKQQSGPTYEEVMRDLANCQDEDTFASLRDIARSLYGSLDQGQKAQMTKAINALEGEFAGSESESGAER